MTRDETFAAYNKCQTKERLICGGLRSGKTYLAAHTILQRIAGANPIVVAIVATNERAIRYVYQQLKVYGLHKILHEAPDTTLVEITWRDRIKEMPEFIQLRNGTEIHFFTSSETWPFDVDVLWIDNEVANSGLGLLAEWRSTIKEYGLFIWSQWDWTGSQESQELWLSHPESQFVLDTQDNPGLPPERVRDLIAVWDDKTERLTGKHP